MTELYVVAAPDPQGVDGISGQSWNDLVNSLKGQNAVNFTFTGTLNLKNTTTVGATPRLTVYATGNADGAAQEGYIFYNQSQFAYINRDAPILIHRYRTSVPGVTICPPAIFILSRSYGDAGANFKGASCIYAKQVDDGDPAHRGVLYVYQGNVAPTTENYPYTPNRDSTIVVLSNSGTVKSSEAIYIGESPPRTVTPTVGNPNGFNMLSGVTVETTADSMFRAIGNCLYGLQLAEITLAPGGLAINAPVGTSVFEKTLVKVADKDAMDVSADGVSVQRSFYVASYGNIGSASMPITFRRARGSRAAPTQTLNGDVLAGMTWQSYDGAAWHSAGGIFLVAKEDVLAGQFGSQMNFTVTKIGEATQMQLLQLKGDGSIVMGEHQRIRITDAGQSIQRSFTLPDVAGQIIVSGGVNVVSPTSPNRTIAVNIGGTVYYIAAKTTND